MMTDCSTKDFTIPSHGDTRPLIHDLLNDNGSRIESVRRILQRESIYHKGDNSSRYDDIWILRFLLSHKRNVKSAAKAAVKTMHFREERKLNELGDIRHRAPSLRSRPSTSSPASDGHDDDHDDNDNVQFPCFLLYNSFARSDYTFVHTQPDTDRGIMSYVDLGNMDLHKAAAETTYEDNVMFNMLQNEVFHQIQDEVTRRTGKLTKMIKVIDLGGVTSPRKFLNFDFIKRDGAASKLMEDCYPQLLARTFFVNCPGWVSKVWTVARHFFPKRAVEKMTFIGRTTTTTTKLVKSKKSNSNANNNKKNAEFFHAYVSNHHLPQQFGGSNTEWPRVDDLAKIFIMAKKRTNK